VLDIVDADGTPVEDELPLAAHAQATHVEKGKVVLLVQSDTSDGKTIVVHVPSDTIGAGAIRVTVANEAIVATNVTGTDATAALAALESAGKGAIVTFAANGTEVTVHVPHFSDQTVTIEQSGEPQPISTSTPPAAGKGAPGFELPLVIVAVALLTIAMRRRA
jgi:hypothetical protein